MGIDMEAVGETSKPKVHITNVVACISKPCGSKSKNIQGGRRSEDWLHGALCQIHWLEGSGKSLKFPYEFFMSEERVEDFDVKNLKEYFKGIRYLSFENLGYIPSNPEGENVFLYNDTSELPVILESLRLFHDNLSKREDCGPVGGNERFKTERSEKESFVNENLFLSYSIGYEDGNFDDIGAALGKYAMRCYYQGWCICRGIEEARNYGCKLSIY